MVNSSDSLSEKKDSLWDKLKNWFTIEPPLSIEDLTYAESSRYTIEYLESEIMYNQKVIRISVASLVIWIICMILYVVFKGDFSSIFDIKLYPSVLWALMSGTFSEFEYLKRKKELNIKLKERKLKDVTTEERKKEKITESDKKDIFIDDDKINDTNWEEYKNILQ